MATKSTEKKPMGRPPKMNEEVFISVCEELEQTHEGLNAICQRYNSSAPAFIAFKNADKSGKLSERYTCARDNQADYMADLIVEVAFSEKNDDNPNNIQRDRLKVDSLKWIASKLKPKKYGDKLDVETNVKVKHKVSFK